MPKPITNLQTLTERMELIRLQDDVPIPSDMTPYMARAVMRLTELDGPVPNTYVDYGYALLKDQRRYERAEQSSMGLDSVMSAASFVATWHHALHKEVASSVDFPDSYNQVAGYAASYVFLTNYLIRPPEGAQVTYSALSKGAELTGDAAHILVAREHGLRVLKLPMAEILQ